MGRWFKLIDSRTGIVLVGTCLFALAFGTAIIADRVAHGIAEDVATFNKREVRNGFVAMSEIQNLTYLVFQASNTANLTDQDRGDIQAAVDFLYVRSEHLKTVFPDQDTFLPSKAVIESLENIIEISDSFLAQRNADYGRFTTQLIAASERARQSLSIYLSELNRDQTTILARQSKVLLAKTRFLWAGVAALSFVSIVAMLFLRREVVARKAWEVAEERVRFLAFFDPLTKLPNRVQLQEKLEKYLEGGGKLAVAIVDVDNFKSVNDTYGHAVGDAILRHIAGILEGRATQMNGFVARLSGDEFAVVIPTDDIRQLSRYCDDVIEQASDPLTFENDTITTGVSIGLTTTSQISIAGQVDISTILRAADFSLYSAKAEGRGCFMFYDNELAAQLEDRNAMLEALPDAITNGDLKLYLQPKVSLPDGKITGFEALVRWQRSGQLVSPLQFITLAEESGHIVDIDNYMLHEAAKFVGNWNRAHGTSFGVSVNLSGVHFANVLVVDEVRRALDASGITPSLLTLEITESIQLNDGQLVQKTLSAFRALGVKISIDDFGAGYSSLAYLRAIAADELKIDRSLVSEIHNSDEAAFVLDAVIDLAENLNMDVIVEGIENAEQASAIHEMGVTKAQGYLFGAPMPAEQALEDATACLPVPQNISLISENRAAAGH